MKLTPKNWPLTTYTDATWTPIVIEAEPAIIASMVMANTSAGPVTVGVRLGDGGTNKVCTIVPAKTIAAGESFTLDLRSINVMIGQSIDVQADVVGAEFLASGVVKEPDPEV